MTKGIKDSGPDGIAGDCFYVLGMYAAEGGVTAARLHELVAWENGSLGWPVPSRGQVQRGLRVLAFRRPPLVEKMPGGRWRQTPHGHVMLLAWTGGEDDEAPVREPCGLGWPG